MALRVLRADGLATVQDLGRFGYQRLGVSPSGAMDSYALRAANLLVGNTPEAAALEVGLAGLSLAATEVCAVALTGAGFTLTVQGQARPLWTALFIQAGWTLELEKAGAGNWAYLAIAGGLLTPPVLGSRAAYLRGGLGGHAVQAGEVLPTSLLGGTSTSLLGGTPTSLLGGTPVGSATQPTALAGRRIPPAQRPSYSLAPVLEVIFGPQQSAFTEAAAETLLTAPYTVSAASDRMGYRLEGAPLAHRAGADILSDGLTTGALQVPASGQPIVMLSDRPTTGGYPKLATVVSADLPLLAQCPPGSGQVRFRATTVEAAQARYRHMQHALAHSVQMPESDLYE